MNSRHIIICSHGFGVKKDDRGLFPDATSEIQNAETTTFDYNLIDDDNNTITISPFDAQVRTLSDVLVKARQENPDSIIDIVAHSQGCVTVALLRAAKIRRVVFLAPPYTLNANRTIEWFKKRDGTEIDLNGVSKLMRRDGSTTLVPKEYFEELSQLKPIDLYNKLAEITELTIINANQDEVLSGPSTFELSNQIRVINIDGDHNFNEPARAALRKNIKQILT